MVEATTTSKPSKLKAPSVAANRQGRYKALAIILGLFLVAGLVGGLWWLTHRGIEDTDDATLEGHIHPVSARVAGTVQDVLVDDNQLVKQGQVLAVLDPTEYKITLSQAEHNLDLAKSQAQTAAKNIAVSQKQATSQITQAQGAIGASQSTVAESQHAVSEAGAAIETARQNVAEQEANYQRALADYNRYKGLDPEAVSAQQLDVITTNLRVAQAARDAAKANLAQTQARYNQVRSTVSGNVSRVTQARGTYQGAQAQAIQVEVVKSQYENALAQVKVAEDAVRQAKLNLGYTEIKAPADGRVGRKTVEAGQRIQPGEPLMSIVPEQVWVVANFKETQMKHMQPGQPVDVAIDAFPDHDFRGWVDSFSPASGAEFAMLPPENATGNFTKIVQRIPVKILLDSKTLKGYQDRLAPGMSVVVKVDTNVTPQQRTSQQQTQTRRGS
jgi:membrane fusion protein (multidrug efflux system)